MSAPDRFPPEAKISREEISRATRHIFLCAGPDCCDSAAGERLWDLLKAETRKLSVPVLRTKAACLRICRAGPWLVVYPDGIWYDRIDARKLCHILKEHIEQGRPVRDWIAADMPNLAMCRLPAPDQQTPPKSHSSSATS